MTQYISDIRVSVNEEDENHLYKNGFIPVLRNLNRETQGKVVYLWYRLGLETPITRIQLSYSNEMSEALQANNYTLVKGNLKEGTSIKPIRLLYYKGSTEYDLKIVSVDVSTDVRDETKMFKFGWEKLACDLNRDTGGPKMYVWVKREHQPPVYVCDITASTTDENHKTLIKDGYIRVDEGTNKSNGDNVFIWYRRTREPAKAITDLEVSVNDGECDKCYGQGYTKLNKNVNEKGNDVFIWYKKGPQDKGIKTITVITDPNAVGPYKGGNIKVIENSLNVGSDATKVYLCYYK